MSSFRHTETKIKGKNKTSIIKRSMRTGLRSVIPILGGLATVQHIENNNSTSIMLKEVFIPPTFNALQGLHLYATIRNANTM